MLRFSLLSFLLLQSWLSGMSQPSIQDFVFEHITIPGTVRSSQVNDMVMDKHGLMWMAGDGLYRYDGFKFTVFKELTPTNSLGGKEIICLLADKKKDKLYLGTHTHGIIEYDYATNSLRAIPNKEGTPIIGMLAQTDDGTVWAGSFGNGLFRIKNDTLCKVPDPKLKYRMLTSLLPIGNDLYLDRPQKLFKVKHGKIIDSLAIRYQGIEFPPTTRLTAMSADSKGNLWLGMERGGVLVYDTLKKSFVKYISQDKAPFYHRINKIFEDANGLMWILTKANGLAIYNPEKDTFIHLTKNPLDEASLAGNNCTSIIQDASGIIWIGSTGDLNKYDPAKIKFHRIFYNPFSSFSLHDNMVRAAYEDTHEKLWVGTDGGVVHIIDRKNLSVEKIPIALPGISEHIVPMYFTELNEQTMLIGSTMGLLEMNRKTKKIAFFKPFENQIRNRQVRQIIKSNDLLYFIHSGSLFIHNLKTGANKSHYNFGNGVINATTIYLDKSGRLWLGVNNGVSLYMPESDSFKYFPLAQQETPVRGANTMILSVFEHQSKLWIGTFNLGLWTRIPSSKTYPKTKGFQTIPCILLYPMKKETYG
jgi:ligand-binding sensor domain-containing protein